MNEEERPEGHKMPEFIVLEEEEHFQRAADGFDLKKIRESRVPFKLRLLCLLLGVFSLLWAWGALVCFSGMILLSLLTFFRFPKLQALSQYFWVTFKRAFVFSLGLSIAFFSPYIGLGVILMYFVMYDGGVAGDVMTKILRTSFKDYMGNGQ